MVFLLLTIQIKKDLLHLRLNEMATKRKTTAEKKAKPNILVSVFIRFLPCFFI